MRIDNWPSDRIMRLPDWCFGQKFQITCQMAAADTGTAFDISEMSFPDRFVIWEFVCNPVIVGSAFSYCRIALGSHLPANEAEMMLLEPLMPGFGNTGPEPKQKLMWPLEQLTHFQLRKQVQASGRKMILQVTAGGATTTVVQIIIVVSAVPREVPDWLISAQAINLP